jgi:hypothetical protein
MPYCSRCGVEVDEGVVACPLCAAPIQVLDGEVPKPASGPYPQRIIDPEDAYRLSKAERRRIGVEILSLATALSSGALFIIDLLPDARLGWSRYAVASIALVWLASTAPLALYGRTKSILAVMGAAAVAFLLVLDGLDGRLGWSLSLGAPIALTSYAFAAATAAIIAARPNKGLNLLGIGALALAAYLVALESILRLGLGASLRPYWSIVAALALVPVAVLLFYLHGRVLRGADLRRIFRL